jgi:hypothetical protein
MENNDRNIERLGGNDGLMKYVPEMTAPRVTVLFFWTFGLYLCVFASGYAVSPEMEREYNSYIVQSEKVVGLVDAQKDFQRAQYALNDVKVWFWRFRSPYSELVPRYQRDLDDAHFKLKPFLAERNALRTKARQSVGLFSE